MRAPTAARQAAGSHAGRPAAGRCAERRAYTQARGHARLLPHAGSDGDEGEGEGGAPEGQLADDLQVAWENLEIAKVIWSKHGDQFAQQLGGERRSSACTHGAQAGIRAGRQAGPYQPGGSKQRLQP